MKSFIAVICALACVHAAVDDKNAEVLKNEYHLTPEGSFNYVAEGSNGILSQASAVVKQVGKDEVALEVQGSNQYISPDGQTIQLSYVANENGYQPQGAHLPTPPAPEPIPDYILRSIEYIKAHPYEEKKL
ncbi:larval cuticle protein LCP-14-like [Pectinophora gossypiella]|uniref:larval cuticle protein LCP-14-like n=1 Tax=Pectinophora gossypiella TaxID=13191 RepID=UPI00214E47ED|nr:larval cuticle protein LCP-14-like [Pectinophora gossypiella]